MWIELEVFGKKYRAADNLIASQAKAAEEFAENIAQLDALKMHLENGSIIVLGKTALQASIITIHP